MTSATTPVPLSESAAPVPTKPVVYSPVPIISTLGVRPAASGGCSRSRFVPFVLFGVEAALFGVFGVDAILGRARGACAASRARNLHVSLRFVTFHLKVKR